MRFLLNYRPWRKKLRKLPLLFSVRGWTLPPDSSKWPSRRIWQNSADRSGASAHAAVYRHSFTENREWTDSHGLGAWVTKRQPDFQYRDLQPDRYKSAQILLCGLSQRWVPAHGRLFQFKETMVNIKQSFNQKSPVPANAGSGASLFQTYFTALFTTLYGRREQPSVEDKYPYVL